MLRVVLQNVVMQSVVAPSSVQWTPGAYAVKQFIAVINNAIVGVRLFPIASHFYPSLIFKGMVESYPLMGLHLSA